MALSKHRKSLSASPEWKATVDGVMKKVQVQLGIEAVQVQQQIQAEAQEQPQEQQIEQQQGMEQPMEGQEQMQQEQQPVLM